MPRKPMTQAQKLALRQKRIDEWRKPGDTSEQAYERYRQYMRLIAAFKPTEESKQKQVETYIKNHGEKAYQKNGRKALGIPKGKRDR